ncbi:MAG: carboxypeptidase M32 [Bacteroidetes bacterium]|nr:MAG: carboxypeptidase M32 [Bacteroidota bacterium]
MSDFRNHLAQICDLNHAAAVLEWDQETYMPSGAAEARAHQIATLRRLAHELLASEKTATHLEKRPDDSFGDNEALYRITKRDFDRATRIPADLVADLAETAALARQAWRTARESDTFKVFAPHLDKILELNLRKAEAVGYDEHPYDALLDEYEPGMKTAEVATVFADLRNQLVPIVQTLTAEKAPDNSMLHRHFPHDAQWDFGLDVIRDFGYDFETGRQDLSAHPFTTTFSISDVRLTTRVDESFFNPAFFGTLHEAGHGMYEQGIDRALERTPLADGTSLGMHESQSRLWENLVGRSRGFWSHYYPKALHAFPDALGGVTEEDFYRAINRVENSLIRVEADEVTYNLHIMVRFELETELVEGKIRVADLPDAWNDRIEAYLGVRPTNDAEGVLQDIHWSLGAIGYFPTYTLGNLMSTQLFDQANSDIPDLAQQISSGNFTVLLDWLRTHVHGHGRKKTASEILTDTTGTGLSVESWIQYIRRKYEDIYGL